MPSIYCAKTTVSWDEKHLRFGIWCAYIRDFTVTSNYHLLLIDFTYKPTGMFVLWSHLPFVYMVLTFSEMTLLQYHIDYSLRNYLVTINVIQWNIMKISMETTEWFCSPFQVLFIIFDKYILHYDDVIMGTIASQITSLTSVYSTVYSGADQSKHQSSASLAFVWGIHRGPVNSPHKRPVTRKMFPFDDVIMALEFCSHSHRACLLVSIIWLADAPYW